MFLVISVTYNGNTGSFSDQEVYAIVVPDKEKAAVEDLKKYGESLNPDRVMVEFQHAKLTGGSKSDTDVQLLVVAETVWT